MQILIQPTTLVLFVIALFYGAIAFYLAARPRKTKAGLLLAVLYGLWTLTWVDGALETSLVWDRMHALLPLRISALLVAYAVHLHFAYAFRGTPFPREARIVIPCGYALALLLSAHPAWTGITGLMTGLTPPPFGEGITASQSLVQMGCLLLLGWSLVVYVRKSVQSTREASGRAIGWGRALLRPVGREARAHVAFLIPWAVILVGFFNEVSAEYLRDALDGARDELPVTIVITALVHPAAFILIYFTYAPEPTSIRVKLSGAALVATLAVFSALFLLVRQDANYKPEEIQFPEGRTLWFMPESEGGYRVEPRSLQSSVSSGQEAPAVVPEPTLGDHLDVGNQAWTPIATGFEFPFAGTMYDTLYVKGMVPVVTLGASPPPQDVLTFQFTEGPYPTLAPLLLSMPPPKAPLTSTMGTTLDYGEVYVRRVAGRLTLTWHEMVCCGGSEDRNTVQLALFADGTFFFSYPRIDTDVGGALRLMPLIGAHPGGEAPLLPFQTAQREAVVAPGGYGLVDNIGRRYRAAVHERLLPFLWLLLGSTGFVLAGFPLLLRSSLTAPIRRLLDGIRRVDRGERDVRVPVGAEDDVGRLTRYFNRMTASLSATEADLRDYAEHLEERVEERTAELRIEKAKTEAQTQQLRELDDAKSRFFANVSHELRTPLTLLLGPIRDARADPARGLPTRHLPAMHRSAERLLTLVDELLDLARLDAGRLRLRVAEHDLVALTRRTVLAFASCAEREGLALAFDTEYERVDAWVDAERFERVVSNLLTNAFKFTPVGGRVRVTLSVEGGADDGDVVLSVRDTGEGIREDLLPHVFERFRQGDDAATRRHEGAGIGLALVRELVGRHGGSVAVESEIGFGSVFTVRLPLGKNHIDEEALVSDLRSEGVPPELAPSSVAEHRDAQAMADGEAIPPATRTDATVLIVEDHDDLRAYLHDLLALHYHVEEAEDGEAGLEKARRLAADGLTPDLVISDVMMPGMDGYALCHALKADDALGHVSVVLLTARADEESKLEGLGEGADDYLAKPFSAEELLARCENLIEVRRRLRARFSGEVVVRPTDVVVEREEADWLGEVKAVCDERLSDSNFGVDWLADELGVSTRTLRRRMKATSGLTPGAFLRTLRLERAAQLLEQGAGVAEAAATVGYTDPEWFSRAFRQGFGVPPSIYAEQAGE